MGFFRRRKQGKKPKPTHSAEEPPAVTADELAARASIDDSSAVGERLARADQFYLHIPIKRAPNGILRKDSPRMIPAELHGRKGMVHIHRDIEQSSTVSSLTFVDRRFLELTESREPMNPMACCTFSQASPEVDDSNSIVEERQSPPKSTRSPTSSWWPLCGSTTTVPEKPQPVPEELQTISLGGDSNRSRAETVSLFDSLEDEAEGIELETVIAVADLEKFSQNHGDQEDDNHSRKGSKRRRLRFPQVRSIPKVQSWKMLGKKKKRTVTSHPRMDPPAGQVNRMAAE